MRAVFFGTPAIAVPALDALREVAEVVAVVCQPDKPAGRGLELRAPPVKERALALGLPVEQPAKVKTPEFAAWLKHQEADFALVIAYGRILPPAVLAAPRRGCLNLHASILPKLRGAAPITWAIADGETVTGVSLMQMDAGMDTGPVYAVRKVPIGPNTTAGELTDTLAACAAEVVRKDLVRAVQGEVRAVPQDDARATHARMLDKSDGLVDFGSPAQRVHDHVRAMTPWPGAFAHLKTPAGTKLFKLLETRLAEGEPSTLPGTVELAGKGSVVVACGSGRIEIVRGQLEGKKPLTAPELIAGRTLVVGAFLGPARASATK